MAERSLVVVTSPAASLLLGTLDHLKEDLEITDGDQDDYLNRLLAVASAELNKAVGRVLTQQEYQQTIHITGTSARFSNARPESLLLAAWPVTELASVTADDQLLVEGTDYELEPVAGMLYRLSSGLPSTWGDGKVVLEFTAGFVAADQPSSTVPADLEQICLDATSQLKTMRGRDRSLRRERVGNVIDQVFADPAANSNSSSTWLADDLFARLDAGYGIPKFA